MSEPLQLIVMQENNFAKQVHIIVYKLINN